ncbi:MAG: bifunctional diaminohydroxyphosphoribosylaminopyrimidine deaminase/5-amino-6-(5-phosphoribosylamino)uracil reductase RibD [Ignavibacteria bacterium]|nr:bifunctional diaminohydroxyphosphoribosylaminopyrimidine deaminase/5-amino-6-(5-phosphoribosylamino)uracil reductase RibD [Ignavibacteria bacterium]MBK7186099.1 bifunctional diaminohydroxyphosphoribosylaminopyrimidine deaminase/5-amino-6-(5-phosphoribosylamino)uracil reductase RibD [Ignavibacteria bacterium]
MATTVNHEEWMQLALDEAHRGSGWVSPNPRVGCVIVRDNELVAKGHHQRFGDVHAEVDALRAFSGDASTATMYVTLEPCAHDGKQPACTNAIIASGIKRVVVGTVDPNPLVSGRGIQILEEHGIDVIRGVRENECQWMNRWFSHHITSGTSYVTLKAATSIDLGASVQQGHDRWISSEESRVVTHVLRSEYDAVMVGIGTVLADDPLLNVRLSEGRDPLRIVVDPNCETPPTSKLAATAKEIRSVIFCGHHSVESEQAMILRGLGFEIIGTAGTTSHLDVATIIRTTGTMGIASILLEGGPTLAASFLNAGCVRELILHIAPAFLGVENTWFKHITPMDITLRSCTSVGPDVHIVYTVTRS